MLKERIPTPEEHFGFNIGDDRKLADWSEIVEYFWEVSKKTDKIIVEELGKTTEGNPFILATISSSKNLKNLEKIRKIQLQLLDPEKLSDNEAEKLIIEGKTIVIISCSIHSTEVGGSQMSVNLLHHLISSEDSKVKEILDNVILLLVPSLNPDGNRIVCEWYKKYLNTPYEGTSPPWLYHKYAGHDNNRDWFMFVLPETKIAVEKIHNRWHPQIVYDLHQMGKKGPRLYVPPYKDPIDPNVDPILVSGINFMGINMAHALTIAGKGGVTIAWGFDAWTPARAYQHYHGGIRILSEAASCDIATPIEVKESEIENERGFKGREARWTHPLPWKGGKWSLKDIVEYEFIAAMALLDNAAKFRERWVRGSYEIGKRSLKITNNQTTFIIPKEQTDPVTTIELLNVLKMGDVRLYKTNEPLTMDGRTYSDGTIIVPTNQPYGRFAKTMLEKQNYPDLRINPTDAPEIPYDVTAHTLGLNMGVIVDQTTNKINCSLELVKEIHVKKGLLFEEGKPYYIFNSEINASTKVTNLLLRKGYTVHRICEWEEINGTIFKPGSFVVEEKEGLEKLLREFTENGINFYGIEELPEIAFTINDPKIGIYKSWSGNADEGWLRLVLEEYKYEYKSLSPQDIRNGNLITKFDVIIFPDQVRDSIVEGMKAQRGAEPSKYEPKYRIGLGEEGIRAIQEFLNEGGSVITLNKSSIFAIKDLLAPVENALEGLKEQEFYCPGSILKVNVDESHPVGYGYSREASVMFVNGVAFNMKDEGYAVVKYPEADPLQSGWILGEKKIRGKAAIVDINAGNGYMVLFGFSPHFRYQTRGTLKMLFNAIYYCAS
ncbi:hypothetical protein JW865_07215 [Candidatus Bathyarchaeota archaeon]|nr:hypothetical protein [Candidatus Bathyarchaeota archaeon]